MEGARPVIEGQKTTDLTAFKQWSTPNSTWQQIGQVVDAVGSGRRQLHEGQEYDYVFDVDVSEGMPPLKLPYNVSGKLAVSSQSHCGPFTHLGDCKLYGEQNS